MDPGNLSATCYSDIKKKTIQLISFAFAIEGYNGMSVGRVLCNGIYTTPFFDWIVSLISSFLSFLCNMYIGPLLDV